MPHRGSVIAALVEKQEQMHQPHDVDTGKRTKSVSALNRDSASLPLRAWPLRGGHYAQVPEILGLDKYQYDVGARLYARAETKFTQKLAEEIPVQQKLDVPGAEIRCERDSEQSKESTVARERFVEAGRKGNAVILWNRTASSTDAGQAQQGKRRQKLTNDLLKEIVVSCGESFKVVSSWFAFFEFYCDTPVDVAMPQLPDNQDDNAQSQVPGEVISSTARPISGRRSPAQLGRFEPTTAGAVSSTSRPRILQSRSISTADVAAQQRTKVHDTMTLCRSPCSNPRSQSASSLFGRHRTDSSLPVDAPKLERPSLRQVPKTVKAPRPQMNEALWQQRHKELGKFKCPLRFGRNICVGDLNLERRCKKEHLDADKFEAWMKGYDEAAIGDLDFAFYGRNSVDFYDDGDEMFPLARRSRALRPTLTKDAFYPARKHIQQVEAQVYNIKDKMWAALLKDPAGDASERSEDDSFSAAVSSTTSECGGENGMPENLTTKQLMIKTVSKSLLTSKLLQKAFTGKQEKVQRKTDEVLAERARILRRVSPVQMTPDSLFRALSVFGLARRKAGSRIFDFLSGYSDSGDGLSFELYLVIMRSLLGGKLRSTQSFSQNIASSSGAHDRPNPWDNAASMDEISWKTSDPLIRLMFTLLSHRNACPAENAAAQQTADTVGVPLSEKILAESLRLFLCPPVLLEIDRGSIRAGGDASDDSNDEVFEGEERIVPGRRSEGSSATTSIVGALSNMQQLQTAQEMLSFEKHYADGRAQTKFIAFVEHLHADLMLSQVEFSAMPDECVSTVPQSVMSFVAFERWVFRSPEVFASLLHLLLPLMPYGVSLTCEEIALAARGLSQRVGELRARVEVKAHELQQKRFMKLHSMYVQPR